MALLASPVAAQLPPPTTTTTTAAATAPTVTGLWPGSGPAAGTNSIYIIGSGFSGATAVRFGGNEATAFIVETNERIAAVVPPPSSPVTTQLGVDVVVETAAGTSMPGEGSSYLYLVAPRIVSVSPDPLTSSTQGGQNVILGVEDGGWPTGVFVDGVSPPYSSYDDVNHRMTFAAPPHAVGPADVVVEGAGGRSAPVTMTYIDTPVPVVDAIAPDHGPVAGGTTVVLTGHNFTGATAVAFDQANPAASFTVDSDTQITVVTPPVPAFGYYPVIVTTPAGVTYPWTAPSFIFEGPPVVEGVGPTAGPLAGGTPVYLWGRDLDRATNVYFGDVPAQSFQITDWYSLTAVAPPHAPGSVNVTVDSALGRSRETMPFEYTDHGPPTVHQVVPDHGPLHGGTTVVLTGSGFSTATAVTFGDAGGPATFTVDSDTQLTAVAPAAPYEGSVSITVTNAVGVSTPTPSGSFNYIAPPYVWSVTPSGGTTAGGTPVELGGSGIESVTSVRFGDTPVAFTFDADRYVLRTVTPAHAAGPVPVIIENENGTSTTTPDWGNTYTYAEPGVPTLRDLSPNYGTDIGGTSVTIWGVDLQNVTGVRFGDTPATSFEIVNTWSVFTVTAVTPPHALGDVQVTLESAAGDSTPGPGTTFSYLPQPPPGLGGLAPSEGPAEGGSNVELWGQGFSHATSVTFGGVPALSFTVHADGNITAVAPPANDQTNASLVHVVVTTPVGATDPDSQSGLYGYRVHLVPTVSSLYPNRGPVGGGNEVQITGAGFTNASSVRFGSHEATFRVTNDRRIVATAPAVADPYLYDVTVTTALGANESSSSSWYLYRSEPVVWGIEANSGSVLGGDTVTIRGDQFLDASYVWFGWNAANFTVVDQHTIVATVPACAAGTVWLTVQTPAGTSAVTLGSLYTYRTPGAPVVSSTDANRGPVTGGQTVVLTGSGFTGTTGVRFEDTPATSFTVESDTRITAVVPPRALPALINISVDTPDGTNPNAPASWFLYQ